MQKHVKFVLIQLVTVPLTTVCKNVQMPCASLSERADLHPGRASHHHLSL